MCYSCLLNATLKDSEVSSKKHSKGVTEDYKKQTLKAKDRAVQDWKEHIAEKEIKSITSRWSFLFSALSSSSTFSAFSAAFLYLATCPWSRPICKPKQDKRNNYSGVPPWAHLPPAVLPFLKSHHNTRHPMN